VASFRDLNLTINALVIDMANKVPTRTTIEIEKGDEIITIAEDEFLQEATYTYVFPQVNADRIIIRMWQKIETFIDDNDNRTYQFRINSISPEYVNFAKDDTIYTNAINVPFPITDVMLESTDSRPVDTDINYFISKDQDKWIPLVPRNLFPNAPSSVVNLSQSSIEQVEDITSKNWQILTPSNQFGNVPLYNILQFTESQYVDIDAKLNIFSDEDDSIVEDSIAVYRGVNDWAIEYLSRNSYIEVSDILYRFKPNEIDAENLDIEDFTYDDLSSLAYVRIDDEGHLITASIEITTKYNIYTNNIKIIDITTGRKVTFDSYTSDGVIQLGTDAVVGNEIVVSYNATIVAIEQKENATVTIDTSSFTYANTAGSDDPIPGIETDTAAQSEIFYSPADRLVHVSRENSLPKNEHGWISVYVSFRYTIKSKDTFKTFRTYVYYEEDTTIEILPFTQEEITAGNYHTIDGINVSTATSYDLKGGWHEIITTQPYKTDPTNSKDINILSNATSNAGIKLGNYTERRAFNKSLRKVSTNALSNIVPPADHRSFAYADGKIYINFIPEQLPEASTLIASHISGNDILGKYARYYEDGKDSFRDYVEQKEIFLIEYKTRPKEGSEKDIRTVYVKAELNVNKNDGVSPSIFKFDVLFF
jgi:hypothetical protein